MASLQMMAALQGFQKRKAGAAHSLPKGAAGQQSLQKQKAGAAQFRLPEPRLSQ